MGTLEQLRSEEDRSRVLITGSGFTPGILDQLKAQPIVKAVIQKNSHLEITLSDHREISSLLGLLIRAGAQVEEVQKNRFSLEEVFLKMMEEETNGS